MIRLRVMEKKPSDKSSLCRIESVSNLPSANEDLLGDIVGTVLVEGPPAIGEYQVSVLLVSRSQRLFLATSERLFDAVD